MARAKADVQRLATFEKGLITEANSLSRPDNCLAAGENVDLARDGSARRRLGLSYEAEYALSSTSYTAEEISTYAISTYEWELVNGSRATALGIVQVGNNLHIYDLLDSSPSSAEIAVMDLSDFAVDSARMPYSSFEYASGNGYLFVASDYMQTAVLFVDPATNVLTGRSITILIRDFEGVAEEAYIDQRPLSLTANHEYNLKNQGWLPTADTNDTGVGGGGGYGSWYPSPGGPGIIDLPDINLPDIGELEEY